MNSSVLLVMWHVNLYDSSFIVQHWKQIFHAILCLLEWLLQIVPATAIPDDWMGLDVGPDATKTFNEALDTTQTIIWNGPMGVFEFEKFAAGTEVNIILH